VQEDPGALVVTVEGQASGLVPGAEVRVQDSTGALTRVGRTNSCGVAAFEPLPDGTYFVRVAGGGTDGPNQQVAVFRGRDSLVSITSRGPGVDHERPASASVCAPPSYLDGPHPTYTPSALTHNVQGCLVLKCMVTAEGLVRRPRLSNL